VRDPTDHRRRLTAVELRPLYGQLARAGVLLGQRVTLGSFGGLRIAIGAGDLLDSPRDDRLPRIFAALKEATTPSRCLRGEAVINLSAVVAGQMPFPRRPRHSESPDNARSMISTGSPGRTHQRHCRVSRALTLNCPSQFGSRTLPWLAPGRQETIDRTRARRHPVRADDRTQEIANEAGERPSREQVSWPYWKVSHASRF
jgi:hypothetical protein